MKKVKAFEYSYSFSLENDINEWLRNNQDVNIITVTIGASSGNYLALVVYEDNE